MRPVRLLVAVLLLLLSAACSDGEPDDPLVNLGSGLPVGAEEVELDPLRFGPDVDHPYWPMEPGTRWTYRGTDAQGVEQGLTTTVSSETRTLADGIVARVVRSTVTRQGAVVEDSLDWYAQQDDGTVWHLGRDSAEIQEGEVASTEGSFEAGVDGALAGVVLPGEPEPGQRYRQEFAAGRAEGNGEVLSLGEQVEVPFGLVEDALLIRETTTLDPDVAAYRVYGPDVGPVLLLHVSGGPGGREELVSRTEVGAQAAAAAGTVPLGQPYP